MKISPLVHRNVVTCSERDTLDLVAAQLWRRNVGCVPVLGDDERLVGMITDRDIAMAAFLQGSPLRSITTSSVMSREVATCGLDDTVATVVGRLFARHLRRMPVIDEDRRVVGIVSLNDIARVAVARELPQTTVDAIFAALAVARSLASTTPQSAAM